MPYQNKKFLEARGYGFGRVLCNEQAEAALKTLTPEQVSAVCELILVGDTEEVATNFETVGKWNVVVENHGEVPVDIEGDTRLHIAASLVHVAGYLPEDIGIFRDESDCISEIRSPATNTVEP